MRRRVELAVDIRLGQRQPEQPPQKQFVARQQTQRAGHTSVTAAQLPSRSHVEEFRLMDQVRLQRHRRVQGTQTVFGQRQLTDAGWWL